MEWIVVVIAAILLMIAHREGMKAGEVKATKAGAEELAQAKEEAINEKVDALDELGRFDKLRAVVKLFRERHAGR